MYGCGNNRGLRGVGMHAGLTSMIPALICGWGLTAAVRVHGLEVGTAELQVTPEIRVGAISWDQLRSQGGHKSIVGLGLRGDLVSGRLGLRIDIEKWRVAEGLDFNAGVVPKGGHRVAVEGRYLVPLRDTLAWYPYAGIAGEEWQRDRTPGNWQSVKFMSPVVGVGLSHDKAFIKAGVSLMILAETDDGTNPRGRFGFESEAGMRIAAVSVGLFWRGAGFQDPDAKMIQSGAFMRYRF